MHLNKPPQKHHENLKNKSGIRQLKTIPTSRGTTKTKGKTPRFPPVLEPDNRIHKPKIETNQHTPAAGISLGCLQASCEQKHWASRTSCLAERAGAGCENKNRGPKPTRKSAGAQGIQGARSHCTGLNS
jgi:hypothetical protein